MKGTLATGAEGGGFTGDCLIVAGPTASGKSAFAVALAREFGGEVVNADSMQVYRDLSILTARPTEAEMGGVPHHLYGLLAADAPCTAGRWLGWMHDLLPEIWSNGRLPVVVGGTGMYLGALIDGLAPVPEVPSAVREAVTADYQAMGAAAFAAELAAVDPVSAAAIPPTNRQRMIRAMEVARHTGRSLSDWQAMPHLGCLGAPPVVIVLDPAREWLYARCDARFDTMLDGGAWHQVKVALAAGIGPDAPVSRGLGTRALMAALKGEIEIPAAVEQAKRETRNYAKRQGTWFRHQFNPDVVLRPPHDLPESPEVLGKVAEILRSRRAAGCKSSPPEG